MVSRAYFHGTTLTHWGTNSFNLSQHADSLGKCRGHTGTGKTSDESVFITSMDSSDETASKLPRIQTLDP